jgi:hypothetical protein
MAYTAPNPLPYKSSLGATATPSGPPRRRYPLIASSPVQFAAYAFDQDFTQLLSSFPPAGKNTPSNNAAFGLSDANAILTNLSQPTNTRAGWGDFAASFAVVPASWDDYQTQVVNLPGLINTITSGKARDAKPTEMTVRVRYDYFVTDPAGVLTGLGVTDSGGSAISIVTNKGKIPIIRRTPWLSTFGGTPQPNVEAKSIVPAAGVAGYLPTLPTAEQYLACAAVATTFLASGSTWNATTPPLWDGASTGTTFGQFVLLNSRLEDYAGNIIARITTYSLFE